MSRLVSALLLLLAACSGGGDSGPQITVLAASSLTDAFTRIGSELERETGANLRLSFGSSATLARQVRDGAAADVLATADDRSMRTVTEDAVTFAANRLAIAVERGNPRRITGLASLADPSLVVVLCAPASPCGGYGQAALARAGVNVNAKSFEENVRGVLTKVAFGEADAGIVYRTDLRAARVDGIAIPDEHNVVARYPIASLTDEGREFVDFVRSDRGRAILAAFGFEQP